MNNTLYYNVFQTIYIKFVNPNTCPDVLSMRIAFQMMDIIVGIQFYKCTFRLAYNN